MKEYTVDEAIATLHNLVEADTGTSERVRDFLISLGHKHPVDLGLLCSLDENNFQAAVTLFSAIKSKQRFDMWEMLVIHGYAK